MGKQLSFSKKIFLCSTILTTSASFCGINLRLDEKPKNISVYNWCKQKAANFVNQKRNALLNLLGLKRQEWQKAKKNLETKYRLGCLATKNEALKNSCPFSDKTKKCIYSVIQNPHIKKTFKITRAINKGNIITAITSDGKNIDFLETSSESFVYTSTSDRVILINPTETEALCPNLNIEAAIGHELGHLLHRHNFEGYCMEEIYKREKNKPYNLHQKNFPSKQKFSKELSEFKKAHETEADIVGIFNNMAFTQKAYSNLNNLSQFYPTYLKNHPSFSERKAHLKNIVQYMEMEQRKVPSKISVRQRTKNFGTQNKKHDKKTKKTAGANKISVMQRTKNIETQNKKHNPGKNILHKIKPQPIKKKTIRYATHKNNPIKKAGLYSKLMGWINLNKKKIVSLSIIFNLLAISYKLLF